MTTHKCHSPPTGVPYPHNLGGHGARRKTFALQQMKRGREEKTLKIVIYVLENRGIESYRKEGRKNDGGRETCVSLFVSGASTQETTRSRKIDRMSKRLSRDERKEGIA